MRSPATGRAAALSIATLGMLGGALAALAPAAAKSAKDDPAPPAIYQSVIDCRALTDAAARLACFDRTVRAMASARDEKELVVMDRAAVREARRGLFGFSLPKLKLFGGGGDDDDADEVKEIETTITGLRSASDGYPIFTLADGARWKQTDGRISYPKTGTAIRIRRAALGSYMAQIDKRAGIRVMRLGN
ncbi:MAG TPA: hypothetical protein VM055_01860 [Novosphingobium sp.]|nr:hypothetical protein [Novosphingobium sp.]